MLNGVAVGYSADGIDRYSYETSIDTPLATSIDYSIGVSIDTALSKLYARVDTMLTMILDQLSHISRGS